MNAKNMKRPKLEYVCCAMIIGLQVAQLTHCRSYFEKFKVCVSWRRSWITSSSYL